MSAYVIKGPRGIENDSCADSIDEAWDSWTRDTDGTSRADWQAQGYTCVPVAITELGKPAEGAVGETCSQCHAPVKVTRLPDGSGFISYAPKNDKLSFDNNGRISVDVDKLVASPKFQQALKDCESIRTAPPAGQTADKNAAGQMPNSARIGTNVDNANTTSATEARTSDLAAPSYFERAGGFRWNDFGGWQQVANAFENDEGVTALYRIRHKAAPTAQNAANSSAGPWCFGQTPNAAAQMPPAKSAAPIDAVNGTDKPGEVGLTSGAAAPSQNAAKDEGRLAVELANLRSRWLDLVSEQSWGDQFDGDFDILADSIAALRISAHPAAQPVATEGFVMVPVEPTEEQWGGLARDIMMWLDMNNGKPTGKSLYVHLQRVGTDAPEWLYKTIPDIDHVPSKGSRVVAIYRAMLTARPKRAQGEEGGMRSLQFLHAKAWLDDDGQHVWQSHNCEEGPDASMLPHPQWHASADGTKVEPSIHCLRCGMHAILDLGAKP